MTTKRYVPCNDCPFNRVMRSVEIFTYMEPGAPREPMLCRESLCLDGKLNYDVSCVSFERNFTKMIGGNA